MISGGVTPGGRLRTLAWQMAVICAMAMSIFTFGWKNTLITPMPLSDCDSMCSMSLTVVVIPRSLLITMREAISGADMPVYCQTTLTTGILMSGKISVGVRKMTTGLTSKIISATTTKV